MKIVVLCGGLSTERNISFLSGTKVCRALRKKGHQAVLVDLFMGLEDIEGEPAKLFEKLPPLKDLTFDGSAPDLKAVRRARKWKSPSLFGKGVLEICREADIVFVALHGMNGEDGRVQATFDMLGIPYTGSGYLGAAIAMDKMLTKEMGEVDFRRSAEAVRGQINGLNPWPCASIPWEDGRLKLMRAAPAEGRGIPGEVLVSDPKEGLVLACGEGAVRILEIQAPGGKRMRTEDFLRGHRIPAGSVL